MPFVTFSLNLFSVDYRPCGLPALFQAPDALPNTVSCLFPEQAKAQLSTKTEGRPTVAQGPVYKAKKYLIKLFSHYVVGPSLYLGIAVCIVL